jgi:rubrerythrin
MHPNTRRQLLDALRGEALSVVRLHAYADKADEDGYGATAQRLRRLASAGLDHAAALLRALGWVGKLHDNILGLVVGDTPVQAVPYARYGHDARQVGDDAAADLFERLTREQAEAGLILLDSLNQPLPSAHPEVSQDASAFAPSRLGLSTHHVPATVDSRSSASHPTPGLARPAEAAMHQPA